MMVSLKYASKTWGLYAVLVLLSVLFVSGLGGGVLAVLLNAALLLVFLVLMLFTKARLVFLVLWILSLILLSAYLICIEYAHDRIEEQLDIEGMSPEDIVHTIEEEREK